MMGRGGPVHGSFAQGERLVEPHVGFGRFKLNSTCCLFVDLLELNYKGRAENSSQQHSSSVVTAALTLRIVGCT